jgi:polyhydroxybutyrate depolymerase
MNRKVAALSLATLVLVGACFARRRGDARDHAPLVEGQLAWGGLDRSYHLHLPRGRDPKRAAPLVLVLHGGGGTGDGMPKLTRHGFEDLADRDGWIVVYPDGVSKNWNDGREVEGSEAHTKKIDDVGFLSALIDDLVAKQGVDPKRVYATGISNGGFMSQRLGRDLSSKIAAIAPVAANLHLEADLATVPSRAVSVLAINGTRDPLVPWEGGDVHFLRRKRGKCRSVAETIAWWTKVDGCAKEPIVTLLEDKDPADGTRARREVHGGGRDGSEVLLYAIEEGGHTWPGGLGYAPELFIGKTCRDFDANEAIWEFFSRH